MNDRMAAGSKIMQSLYCGNLKVDLLAHSEAWPKKERNGQYQRGLTPQKSGNDHFLMQTMFE